MVDSNKVNLILKNFEIAIYLLQFKMKTIKEMQGDSKIKSNLSNELTSTLSAVVEKLLCDLRDDEKMVVLKPINDKLGLDFRGGGNRGKGGHA